MYPNYLQDRKSSGYKCLIDTQCGNRLVLITDSSVVFVKNVTLNGKRKICVIIVGMIIIFSYVKPAQAIGPNNLPTQQRVVSITYRDTSSLIKPTNIKLDSDIQAKIIMPSLSIRTKSDLQNSQGLKESVSTIRGGDDGLVQFLVRILWIWVISQNLGQTDGFQPVKPIYPGIPVQGQPSPRIAAKLQENPINRNNPRSLGCQPNQNNQDGTLTKEQRRNLPSPDDLVISEENVIIRDGQAKHKIKNHGYDFGIPSTQNPSGKFKTEKTRENIEAFKKETKEFVSGWILSEGQIQDLLTNGNIGDY
jgi:hypothetical protein